MTKQHRARGQALLGLALALGSALLLAGCAGTPLRGALGGAPEAAAAGTSASPAIEGDDQIITTALPGPMENGDPEQRAFAEIGAETFGEARALSPPDPSLPETARRAPPHRAAARATDPEAKRPVLRPATAPAAAPSLPTPTTVFGQQVQQRLKNQCAQSGGRLGRRGASDALTCFIQPKDAGKRCSRASDCQGACLARSGTCSPVIPLLGCHEILLDSGLRVTECRD